MLAAKNSHDKYTTPELSLKLKAVGIIQEAGDQLYWTWEGRSKKPYLLFLNDQPGSKKEGYIEEFVKRWSPNRKIVLARAFRLDELIDEILRISPKEHVYFNKAEQKCRQIKTVSNHWSCYLAWSLPDEICGKTPVEAVGNALLRMAENENVEG